MGLIELYSILVFQIVSHKTSKYGRMKNEDEATSRTDNTRGSQVLLMLMAAACLQACFPQNLCW